MRVRTPAGSLTFVGTGLYAAGQITPESLASIESAERLLHLVVDPVSRDWLEELRPGSESLFDAYADGKPRRQSYAEMADRTLAPARAGRDVCVALYGHPGVLVDPSHAAIAAARAEGIPARMLPGISSEDCLFADLEIDPAAAGCQSFEATDFLVRERVRRIDPRAALVLWQIGAIGVVTYRNEELWNAAGLERLVETLARRYPPDHAVVVYEAPRFAIATPSIQTVPLSGLAGSRVTTSSTLYVPPIGVPRPGAPSPARSSGGPTLTLVGLGYRVAGHATPETVAAIEDAGRVFHLVTDPATGAWVETLNPTAESLADAYRENESGAAASERMVGRILAPLREGRDVCAAFYGHPAVGLSAPHRAAKRARQEGFTARFLPAVSFEDCLFADVGLDPGDDGRFLFDADDFLRRSPTVDATSALLLIQAGAVGLTEYRSGSEPAREGLARLSEALSRLYGEDHEAVVYEAADFPFREPTIEAVRLKDLRDAPMTIRSTLYVPRLEPAPRDERIAEELARAAG
jgi:uncharacterized protein YabN with tetrapyrrole methylase and pyrophosphatase domain